MDMYCTEDELILIRQGLKKRDGNPAYQLQPAEIVALTCALVRGEIKTLLLDSPEDNPPPKVTSTFDAQTPCIQKKIRRHELELRVALACGVTDFELELNLCGLTKDFVSSDVVLCCLSELLKERCIREMLGYGPDDLSVEQQAEQKGLVMVNPDRKRGQYVGQVVGLDHRSALIEFARGKAVELPLEELAVGQERPGFGGTVRMKFKDGALVFSVAERQGRQHANRE